MSDDELEVDKASSAGSVGASTRASGGQRGKRGKVLDCLGDTVAHEEIARARKVVINAVRTDDQMARKLAFLVTSGKLRSRSSPLEGKLTLPPCANKYHLIGRERIMELLLDLFPKFNGVALKTLALEDLQTLIRFALCLHVRCAIPTRVWDGVKRHAMERYKAIGGNRLERIVFVKKGEGKRIYYEVNYDEGGAYKLVKKGKKIVGLQHCNGVSAKVVPALDDVYTIKDNNLDDLATLVSNDNISEIPVKKVFEKDKKGNLIPTMLTEDRIGQSPNKQGHTKKELLAISDGRADDDVADVPAFAEGDTTEPQSKRLRLRQPPGMGSVVKAAPPPRKRN